MKNEINCIPIRLCFINVYTYPNPKPTPYRNEKIVTIVVQCDKNYAVLMCACPVAPYASILALTEEAERCPKTVSCIPVTLNLFPSIFVWLSGLLSACSGTLRPPVPLLYTYSLFMNVSVPGLFGCRNVSYVKLHHPCIFKYTSLILIFVCAGNMIGLFVLPFF